MSYTFNSATRSTTASTAALASYVVSSGQSLIIVVFDEGGINASHTISDGTNTYTKRGSVNETNGGTTTTLLDCMSPTPGTYTLTLGGQLSAGFAQFVVVNYSGLASFSPSSFVSHDYSGSVPTTTNGVAASSITPSSYNALVFGAIGYFSSETIAAGTGYTLRSNGSGGFFFYLEDLELASGSSTPAFTASGTFSGLSVVGASYIETVIPPIPLVGQTTPTTSGTGNNQAAGTLFWYSFFNAYAATGGTATDINAYVSATGGGATTLYAGLYSSSGTLLASGSIAIATGLLTIPISNTPIAYGAQYTVSWQVDAGTVSIADNGATGGSCLGAAHAAGLPPSTLPTTGVIATAPGVPSIYISGQPNALPSGTPLGGPGRTQWHWR